MDSQDHFIKHDLPAAQVEYVRTLINDLLSLRLESDMAKGAATERGKDLRAFEALQVAGELVSALAGWAVNHNVGLAVEALSFYPLQPTQIRKLPEHQAAQDNVDSHRHETTGRRVAERLEEITPDLARRIAINLVGANSGAMPQIVAEMLGTALRAIDIGDYEPILESPAKGRKVSFAEQQLQLQAICFWKFRHSTGVFGAGESRSIVANSFGVSADAVSTWEKRLRDELGTLEVSRNIAFATNSAAKAKAATPKSLALALLENHPIYGDEPMRRVAQRYQSVRRGS